MLKLILCTPGFSNVSCTFVAFWHYFLPACESGDTELLCVEGTINILEAFYGRDDNTTCYHRRSTMQDTNCLSGKYMHNYVEETGSL